MSYGIHPYAVAMKKIEGAIGSKSTRVLQAIQQANDSEFSDDDDEVDEEDEEEISLRQAAERLIFGQPLGDVYGYKYAYVIKFLSEHYGRMLDNGDWSSIGWEWVEAIDESLAEAGVAAETFRVQRLLGRALPFDLPSIDDFPSTGYLLLSEMPGVSAALAQVSESDLDGEEQWSSLLQIRSWLDYCTRERLDLICFYH